MGVGRLVVHREEVRPPGLRIGRVDKRPIGPWVEMGSQQGTRCFARLHSEAAGGHQFRKASFSAHVREMLSGPPFRPSRSLTVRRDTRRGPIDPQARGGPPRWRQPIANRRRGVEGSTWGWTRLTRS